MQTKICARIRKRELYQSKIPEKIDKTKVKIARKLLKPFRLTITHIKKEKIEDYEIEMMLDLFPEYSFEYVRGLMDEVQQGKVR